MEKISLSTDEWNNVCNDFAIENAIASCDDYFAKDSSLKDAVGVLFSGGYDSVALTIYLLEKGFTVLPVALRFNGTYETVLRVSCIKQLQKVYGQKLLPCYEFKTIFYGDGDTHLGQQSLCHFWMRFLPEEIKQNLSMICIGYNKDDFGTCAKEKLIDLYHSEMNVYINFYCDIASIHEDSKNKHVPKVKYPLIQNNHSCNVELVNSFTNEHNNLILPCVACGSLEYRLYKKGDNYRITIQPCGACDKCGTDSAYKDVKPDSIRVLDFVNLENNINAKAKADAEVEKMKEVIEAQKKAEVAKLAAQQAKFEAEKIRVQGEAEAYVAKKKVEACLTSLEKANIEMETKIGIAKALAGVKFPERMVIAGGGEKGGANPFDAVGLQALYDLSNKLATK